MSTSHAKMTSAECHAANKLANQSTVKNIRALGESQIDLSKFVIQLRVYPRRAYNTRAPKFFLHLKRN